MIKGTYFLGQELSLFISVPAGLTRTLSKYTGQQMEIHLFALRQLYHLVKRNE